MILTVLASSSTANSAIIRTETTALMVDAGLPRGTAFTAMAKAGINPESLSAVLLSHNHQDHSRGAESICRRLAIPLHCSKGTATAMPWTRSLPRISTFLPEESFKIGDISIVPFSIPHDAAEPVGFWFSTTNRSIAIATDLGHVPEAVALWFVGSDVVMIESSYEPDVLSACEHNVMVKRRVMSDTGHLSNEKACALLARLNESTSTVVLAHLSEKANEGELVLMRARKAMNGYNRKLVLARDVIGESL